MIKNTIIHKTSRKNYPIYIFFLVLFSFIIGFFLNEDSAGGGLTDFGHEWVSFLEFKKFGLDALTSIKYESSRTPLFLILNYFNIFAVNEFTYRLTNFIFNFLIIFTYYLCLKEKKEFNLDNILLILCILILSPYFRTTSFWAHQENLPYLFFFLSFIYLIKFEEKITENTFSKLIAISILSSLSFYSDQKFIFLSFYTFLYVCYTFKFNFQKIFIVFLIYVATAIPALYLFYIWGGIVPKQSQFRIGFYYENISASISIISFYFIPCIIIFIKNLFDKKIKISYDKKDIIILFIFLVINILTVPSFNSSWGNGIIIKIFFILKNLLGINLIFLKFIYILFLQASFIVIYLLLKKNALNFLPLVIVVILSALVERTYNEYFDPLIVTLIFIFFKFNKSFLDNKQKLIVPYLIFYLLFLAIANIYYISFDLNNNF